MAEITHREKPLPKHKPEHPASHDHPNQPIMRSGRWSRQALELRKLRNHVKFVASLLSTQGKVREKMSDKWACEYIDRIIYWRPSSPLPPFEPLTPNLVLYLEAHEAGHLNYTGGYEIPEDWSADKRAAFQGFWNGVEDIRIERLMGVEFPGFEKIRHGMNVHFLKQHASLDHEQYALWHQVVFNWIALENGAFRVGVKGAKKFAEDLWPDVSKICNADDSNEVAQAIIPIFEKLWEEEPSQGGGGGDGLKGAADDLQGCGDGFGDEPSKNPRKSPLGEGNKPLSAEEQMKLWQMFAEGIAQQQLEAMVGHDEDAKEEAGEDMLVGVGSEAGDSAGDSKEPNDAWDQAKDHMQPQISALAHRLRSVLKTNSMSNWQEGKRRGRLNSRRAYRAVAGNNRIFRNRSEIGARDYAWGIMPDVSGSMAGSKARDTLYATVLLAEAFEKAGMSCFVIPWDTTLHARKSMGRKIASVKDQLGADIIDPTGGTYEAPVLVAALEEFASLPSRHRVMFVISDGQTNGVDESEQMISELEDMGVVDFGVGIGIPAPSHHTIQVSCDDAAELVELLPRLVNEHIRKGGK